MPVMDTVHGRHHFNPLSKRECTMNAHSKLNRRHAIQALVASTIMHPILVQSSSIALPHSPQQDAQKTLSQKRTTVPNAAPFVMSF